MKVFFDTSVIIASLLSSTGGSRRIFKYIKTGLIVGITSQTVLDELMEEEKQKKLKKSKIELDQFIIQSGLLVRKRILPLELESYKNKVDVEDAHLISGAILTKCTHLVTLDRKHLLRQDIQQRFLPLQILSPKDLLEEILSP